MKSPLKRGNSSFRDRFGGIREGASMNVHYPSSVDRNRLLFKSWHRGTQESDLLLGSFADCCLTGLDVSQLNRFEALLDCSDPDLFEWILDGGVPPAQHDHDVLHLLRAYWSQRHDKALEQSRTNITARGE